MRAKSTAVVVALLGLVLVAYGCAAVAGAAAGAGTYAWTQGKLSFSTPDPVPEVQDAVLDAFEELDIQMTEQEVDPLGGTIKGITETGEEVTIDLQPQAEDITEVEIRVGFFGDRGASERIADAIRANL